LPRRLDNLARRRTHRPAGHDWRQRGLVVALVATLIAVAAPSAASADDSAAPPPAGATDAEVYTTEPQPDGSTLVTIYRPAPGVSADELAASLSASGIAEVEVVADIADGATDVAAAGLPCGVRSARSLRCPVVRWAYNGFADPQVYFLDHTSAAWPMTAAVATWNQAVGIDSYYRWYTAGCPARGTHCLNVYDDA
jgi:hypothetical protein